MNQPNKLNTIDFAVGGQAVIEGVMMRSPNFNIVSVRSPQGKIEETQEFYQNLIQRKKFLNIPILRGVINMLEMMLIGTKALNYSSQIALSDLDQQNPSSSSKNPVATNSSDTNSSVTSENPKDSSTTTKTSKTTETVMLILSLVFALAMSLFLFKFLPLWLTDFLSQHFAVIQQNYLVYNLLDGIIKSSFFVAYIAILATLPDVKRVFQYHGAEHKSIRTYEQGLDLTIENAQKQTRFHPRCGTSFILIVFLISVFVFTIVPRHPDFYTNFAIRVAFLPIIAGISYEFLKLSAKYPNNVFFQIIAKPGLLMQRLTTSEPTPDMLEVSLNSLKLALQAEENLKQKNNNASIIL